MKLSKKKICDTLKEKYECDIELVKMDGFYYLYPRPEGRGYKV